MRHLVATGHARELSTVLPGYLHHHDHWWVAGRNQTWLQITDPHLAATLDQAATAWTHAENTLTRHPTTRPT